MRYVKCLGGPRGREGIMVACRDGRVLKVFVNNAFPCHVWRHPRPIRYADISIDSSGLAVIDDESKLTVINLLTGVVSNLLNCSHASAVNRACCRLLSSVPGVQKWHTQTFLLPTSTGIILQSH